MRAYALLLGTLATVGSAYVAQVALASSGFDRAWAVLHPAADPPSLDPLWYGGILDPVTIEGHRPAGQSLTVMGLDPAHHGECPVTQSKYRPTSSENVRTSIGLVM